MPAEPEVVLELAGLFADDDQGLPAVEAVNLKVHAGEIVGIAGVSGNGQSELVEVLSGQRDATDGRHLHPRQAVRARRATHMDQLQGVRPAGGAAAQRRRAAHDGGREHLLPHLRQAADHLARLVAVAGADAQRGRAS